MDSILPESPADGGDITRFDQPIDALLKKIEKDPENVELHTQLRDVSLRRTAAGGKPAGGFLGPTLPYAGRSDKEKMLNAEYVLAHDPANIPAMMDLYRAAEKLGHQDVMNWIATILRAATAPSTTRR